MDIAISRLIIKLGVVVSTVTIKPTQYIAPKLTDRATAMQATVTSKSLPLWTTIHSTRKAIGIAIMSILARLFSESSTPTFTSVGTDVMPLKLSCGSQRSTRSWSFPCAPLSKSSASFDVGRAAIVHCASVALPPAATSPGPMEMLSPNHSVAFDAKAVSWPEALSASLRAKEKPRMPGRSSTCWGGSTSSMATKSVTSRIEGKTVCVCSSSL
mmetsp:Transcript_287/g.788  ORF Transcript_287/g.788 Transcript_287/m.788 type:complete len:213 (-) Transcript_287:102-740(-)